MIALAGYFHAQRRDFARPDMLVARGNLRLSGGDEVRGTILDMEGPSERPRMSRPPEGPRLDENDSLNGRSEAADAFAKMREQTAVIEAAVERGALEGDVAEALRSDAGPEILKRSPNLARTIAAGLFALGLQVGDVFAQSSGDRDYTPEQERTLEAITGMPFAELIKKFDAEISVDPGPEGKFIVHIGQRHADPKRGISRAMNASGTILAQQRLEPLIESVARANNVPCVFMEGVGENGEEFMAFLKRRISERMTEIDRAMSDPNPTISSIHESVRSLSEVENPVSLGHLDKRLEALFKKYSEILPSLKTQNAEESIALDLIAAMLTTRALGRAVSNFMDRSDPYHAGGATFKLYFDGKIPAICGAESEAANKRGVNALRALEAAQTLLDKKRGGLLDELYASEQYKTLFGRFEAASKAARRGLDGKIIPEDLGPVRELFDQIQALRNATLSNKLDVEQEAVDRAEKEFTAIAMGTREAEALRQIDQYDMKNISLGYSLGNVAMVYGSAHDFSSAVRNWNQGNSPHQPIQRGLIKLKIRE